MSTAASLKNRHAVFHPLLPTDNVTIALSATTSIAIIACIVVARLLLLSLLLLLLLLAMNLQSLPLQVLICLGGGGFASRRGGG